MSLRSVFVSSLINEFGRNYGKIIILFVIVFISQYSYSQSWEYKELVDEFGDKSGVKRYTLKVIGSFNNSAQVGSKAILYLSFNGGYSEYDESIGDLRFKLYEYNNNPADFYRKHNTLNVSMKNNNGDVFKSEIMTNEYQDDNEFLMTQYLYPNQRIKERTQRKDIDDLTYVLIKPTYDIDFKIIEEIIYKKQSIKLNIYTDNSSYYFKFKSLGKEYPNSLIELIKEAKSKTNKQLIEKEKLEDEEEIKKDKRENKIKELIQSPYIDNLDNNSLEFVEYFLKKLKDDVLLGLTKIELTTPKNDRMTTNSMSPKVIESMFKNYGHVSLNLFSGKDELDVYSEDIFITKDETGKTLNRYIYKAILNLKIKPNSKFFNDYEIERKNILKNLYLRVENLLSDDFGGRYLKDEIKEDIDFDLSRYKVKSMETISYKFTKEIFEYKILYSNGRVREGSVKLNDYSAKSKKIKSKKILKSNNLEYYKTYNR